MKFIMLTGSTYKEVMDMNVFTFFALLDASEAVVAEQSIRNIKINDNHLLLNSKNRSGEYPELLKHFKRILSSKGIKSWHTKADTNGLQQLKNMLKRR